MFKSRGSLREMAPIKVFYLLMALLAIVCGGKAVIAQDFGDLKAGVVKITAKTGKVGAGFIVRIEPEVLYIVTAAHVIAGDPHPTVEFYSPNLGAVEQLSALRLVLPGAQVDDDLRGLAVISVREKEYLPQNVKPLAFEESMRLVSGGEEAIIIGHPGVGGGWAVAKRNISNRVIHDIMLDPGVASRFSGGPIIVDGKVVGIVMSNQGEFGLGLTHKSVLNYLEGMGIEPQSKRERNPNSFGAGIQQPSTVETPQPTTPTTRQIGEEFELQLGQVYSHPRDHLIAIMFDGSVVRVTLPTSRQPSPPLPLPLFHSHEWIRLRDDIPISIMRIDNNRLLAQWEP